MPIRGISERTRLPRVGKLHLGVRDPERGFPRPVDHFVVHADNSTSEGAIAAFRKVYGDEPKVLDVMFPTEPEGNEEPPWATQFYKAYTTTRGLICRGDGERAMALLDTAELEKRGGDLSHPVPWATAQTKGTVLTEIDCPAEDCIMQQRGQCRRVMNLQFLLPKVGILGVWQIDTSSLHSMINVNSTVRLVKGLVGRISLLPLQLEVVMQEVTPEGQSKKRVPVLHLHAPYGLEDLACRAALAAKPGAALLPPPTAEPPEDLYPAESPAEPPAMLREEEGEELEKPIVEPVLQLADAPLSYAQQLGPFAKKRRDGQLNPDVVAFQAAVADTGATIQDVRKIIGVPPLLSAWLKEEPRRSLPALLKYIKGLKAVPQQADDPEDNELPLE